MIRLKALFYKLIGIYFVARITFFLSYDYVFLKSFDNDDNSISHNCNYIYKQNFNSSHINLETCPIPLVILEDIEACYNEKNNYVNRCPPIPKALAGSIEVEQDFTNATNGLSNYTDIEAGGYWKPPSCTSYQKIALIVPYRDRPKQLPLFLNHMHKFLQKQNIEYRIFIVEQSGGNKFNRAMLFNVGFKMVSEIDDYDCYVFHDLDLMPINDENMYICSSVPRHMSVAVDTLNYTLPYPEIFGGVVSMKKEHFIKVNGFSNVFFGWGGEDDDMSRRLKHYGLKKTRYPPEISRYIMLGHKKEKKDVKRTWSLLKRWKTRLSDGISNLKFNLIKKENLSLYSRIFVDLNMGNNEKHVLI